ncbi:hypothetical protein ACIPPJ_07195 [Streptomyces sp. NPDC086091]|uniref:hypothetical protein n=1 Tax=Streptomyces sp. NPDC086091 TaxID=3365751 RepID=UPI0038013794
MRRGLVLVLAWLLATGAAVTLSWWGVHTVMAGTAYDPPRAVPLAAAEARPDGGAGRPDASSSAAPSGSPAASAAPDPDGSAGPAVPPGSSSSDGPAPSRSPGPTRNTPSPSAPPTSKGPSGEVKSYDTDGGRVLFDIGTASAALVSATPGAGWSMQVWKTESWIRVEFASGADRVSVFCTWHDGPPRVEVNTY